MKRKILKLGSSYVITLPNEWVEENNLEKGDHLNIVVSGNNIILSRPSSNDTESKTVLKFERNLKNFLKKVISAYFKNYKTIEITGEDLDKELEYIRQITYKLSTLQIYEITKDKIVLQDIVDMNLIKLENLINSIISSIKVLFSELEKEIVNIDFLYEVDSNINKLAYLSYKSINHSLMKNGGSLKVENSINFWRIVFALEEIGDIVKRIGRYLVYERLDNSLRKEILVIIKETELYFNFISQFILNNGEDILEEYLDRKQGLLKEIELRKNQFEDKLKIYLVVSQLCKDIIGKIEMIVVSLIDMDA